MRDRKFSVGNLGPSGRQLVGNWQAGPGRIGVKARPFFPAFTVARSPSRWVLEPVISEQIQALLVAHQGDDEVDTLDAMTELLGHLNVTIRAARRVLAQANAVAGEA
ncbi:hypothetical protein [Pseudomonas sp. RL]|uniref:hypothetical protein n=1 Tax=Pseudomonas sp. RL TaxID=1452718 RepID=UPI0012DDDF1C|nr:hypothetical protein [Pseudomonas sp. RL]